MEETNLNPLENPELLAELKNAQSMEDAAAICQRYSIPVTAQELAAAQEEAEEENDEMNEAALDHVAGGRISIWRFWPPRFPWPLPRPLPRSPLYPRPPKHPR